MRRMPANSFAAPWISRMACLWGDRRDGRRALLAEGHGRLAPEEVEVIVALLSSIRSSGFVFQDKCAICHVRASDLARRELILKDGELYGRYSGRDIAAFLARHGRLTGAELPDMLATLKRQLTPGDAAAP